MSVCDVAPRRLDARYPSRVFSTENRGTEDLPHRQGHEGSCCAGAIGTARLGESKSPKFPRRDGATRNAFSSPEIPIFQAATPTGRSLRGATVSRRWADQIGSPGRTNTPNFCGFIQRGRKLGQGRRDHQCRFHRASETRSSKGCQYTFFSFRYTHLFRTLDVALLAFGEVVAPHLL